MKSLNNSISHGANQLGLSLIEMMVALVLGLVLIGGIGHLFLSANRTYMLQDELSRIQENARFAIDLISRDLRMSGYTGCPADTDLANALFTSTSNREWMTHFDKGVLGIPLANKSRIDDAATSDAVVIHRLDWEQGIAATNHNTTTGQLTLASSHSFKQGSLLAAVKQDCQQVSLFKAGATTSGSTISHEASTSGSLYNCTSQLKGNYNCMDSASAAGSIDHSNSQIVPVTSVVYYLRESNGVSNLYRKYAGETVSGSAQSAEGLLEGIERLNLLYGYDSDGDGIANQYRTASDIGLFSTDWNKVTSVRVELLIRSFQEVADSPQPFFFAGNRTTPTDNYLRRSFAMTVELRNRVKQ